MVKDKLTQLFAPHRVIGTPNVHYYRFYVKEDVKTICGLGIL